MQEIEKQFVTEFDYAGEARNMQEIHDNLLEPWGDKIVIPEPVTELCTTEVLVMDELQAPSLVKGLRANYSKMAALQGTTLEAMEEAMKAQIRAGTYKYKDINEEAERIRQAGWWLQIMDTAKNTSFGVYNWTVGLLAGQIEYAQTEQPINLGEILQTLSEVHAYQIFINGKHGHTCMIILGV